MRVSVVVGVLMLGSVLAHAGVYFEAEPMGVVEPANKCCPCQPAKPPVKHYKKVVVPKPPEKACVTKCPDNCPPACDLSGVEEQLGLLIKRKAPLCQPVPCEQVPCDRDGNYMRSSLPPETGHWVSGFGVWRLPSSSAFRAYSVVADERRSDPRTTFRRDAAWMPYVSGGYEWGNGVRLVAQVGYVTGGGPEIEATPLHYEPWQRVVGIREEEKWSPWAFGAGVEWKW